MSNKLARNNFSISTHTLLAEGDLVGLGGFQCKIISTHTLLAEGDRERPE